jgi:hypothetical protein
MGTVLCGYAKAKDGKLVLIGRLADRGSDDFVQPQTPSIQSFVDHQAD